MKKLIKKISEKPAEVLGMKKGVYWFLIGIILFAFLFRLYFTSQTDFFSNDAYFGLRQVDSIVDNFRSLKYDDLSYGGREFVFNSLFYYILAFFSFVISPVFAFKILPLIFSVSLVLIVYLMSFKLTGNTLASLISALIVGFIPIHLNKTLNHLSVYSLAIPLFFLMLYYLIEVDSNKKYVNYLIVLSFLLPLLHPIAFLFTLTMVFYFILNVVENVNISKIKREIILFSSLLVFLISFVIYKKAFLEYGIGVIWQNIPNRILSDYFSSFDIFNAVFLIGLIPLVLGIIGFVYAFHSKKDSAILLSALGLSVFFLLLLKLISLDIGLIFLGISLAIFSSLALSRIFVAIRKTKLYKYENLFFVLLFLLVLFFSIIPASKVGEDIVSGTLDRSDISIISWLDENSLENETIMAPPNYGYVINYFAKRKNVLDESYLLAPDANERFEDTVRVYSGFSEVKALEVLNEYDVQYLYIPKDVDKLDYVKDGKCFRRRKEGLYEVLC